MTESMGRPIYGPVSKAPVSPDPIHIDPALLRRLQNFADDHKETLSRWVNRAVRQSLDQWEEEETGMVGGAA